MIACGSLRAMMIRDITTFHRRACLPSRTTLTAPASAGDMTFYVSSFTNMVAGKPMMIDYCGTP